MTEERPGSGPQPAQQKRRAWLRRASTSSDQQPPPLRSAGRRLSAYDQLIAERVRRGITVNLERRSSVVSTGSSEPESVDSGSGSISGSGPRSGSGADAGSREPAEASLRQLAPRADPLDESQLTSGAVHREGAAHCQKANGVPLLDHLIQLAAERGAKQGANSRPMEPTEEKRVRFREGWRSARGTGSLSSMHEDEVKSVAERMTPCGILKNGNCAASKEESQKDEDIIVDGETEEKMCIGANHHTVESNAQDSVSAETEKAAEISSNCREPLSSAWTKEEHENDDIFEPKAVTPNTNDNINMQSDIKQVDEASQPTENTNSENEIPPSTVEPSDVTGSQCEFNAEATDELSEEVEYASADDISCELIAGNEPSIEAPSSKKDESTREKPADKDPISCESSPTVSSAPSSDAQAAVVSSDSSNAPASYSPAVSSASSSKVRRTRLDSVPEEPPSSPSHLRTGAPADSSAHSSVHSAVSGDQEGDPPPGARQQTMPPAEFRSARGAPSRRWSVSGEPTSHRRDRAAISRRLVYLTLSEEGGQVAPVFEEPTGAAVEFDPHRGEWRHLTEEEGQRLAQRRRMSLTKTCSLDFDRIP